MDDELKQIISTDRSFYVELAPGTIASDYALRELNKALGAAQLEFAPAVKGEINTYGGYNYTPLIAIVSAVRPSLTKNHLTVSQFCVNDLGAKTVSLYTRIVHWDSGEWMHNLSEMPAELALGKGGTPVFNQQTIGGSQTYAQKYAYKAIVGIPDSEEMIDSTEEKGDLPARKRPTLDNPPQAPSVRPPTGTPIERAHARVTESEAQQQAEQGHFAQFGENLECIIKAVTEKESKKGTYLLVTFNGRVDGFNYAAVWHKTLNEALMGAVNKSAVLKLSKKMTDDGKAVKFLNVEDVFAIDGVQYKKGQPDVLLTQLTKSVEAEDDQIPF